MQAGACGCCGSAAIRTAFTNRPGATPIISSGSTAAAAPISKSATAARFFTHALARGLWTRVAAGGRVFLCARDLLRGGQGVVEFVGMFTVGDDDREFAGDAGELAGAGIGDHDNILHRRAAG